MGDLDPRNELRKFAKLARSLGNKAVSAAYLVDSWPEGQVITLRQAISTLEWLEPFLSGIVPDRKRKFSWQEAVELRKSKMSVAEISRRLRVSRSSVQNALARSGISPGVHVSPNHQLLDREMIAQAYLAGLTLEQLAIHYKTSPGSIKRALISKGIQPRKQGSLPVKTNDESSTSRDMALTNKDDVMLAMILAAQAKRRKGTVPTVSE